MGDAFGYKIEHMSFGEQTPIFKLPAAQLFAAETASVDDTHVCESSLLQMFTPTLGKGSV